MADKTKSKDQIIFEQSARGLNAPDQDYSRTTEGGVPQTIAENITSKNRSFQKKTISDPALAIPSMLGNLLLPGKPFGKDNPFVATQKQLDARSAELQNLKLKRKSVNEVRSNISFLIKDVQDKYGENPPEEIKQKLMAGVDGYIKSAGLRQTDISHISPQSLMAEDEFGFFSDQPEPYPIIENSMEFLAGTAGSLKGFNTGQKYAKKRWGEGLMRNGSRLKGPWWAKVGGAVLGGALSYGAADYGYETMLDVANRAGRAKEFLKKGQLDQLNLIDMGLAQLPESFTFGPKGINRPDEKTKIKSALKDASIDAAFSSVFFGARPAYLGLKKVVGGGIFKVGKGRPSEFAPGGEDIIRAEQDLLASGKFDSYLTDDFTKKTLRAPSENLTSASSIAGPPIPVVSKIIDRLGRSKVFNFLSPQEAKSTKFYPSIPPAGPKTGVLRADVSGQTLRGLYKMLGKMPIFGGRAVQNKAQQLDFYNNLGRSMIQNLTFAPLINLADQGIKIQNLSNTSARGFITAAGDKQNALLEASRKYGAVVNDENLVNTAKKIYERLMEQRQIMPGDNSRYGANAGATRIPKQSPEPLLDFLKKQIIDPGVAGARNLEMYYGLKDDMDKQVLKWIKNADNESTNDIYDLYRAWETDIGSLTDSGIPEVAKLWTDYENFVSNGMLMFGTKAGRALVGDMDRFGMSINFNPEKKAKDMFNTVLDIAKKDPANAENTLAVMRNIVGDKAYYEGLGKYVNDAFSNSMVEKSGLMFFDAEAFRKSLGLNKDSPVSNLFEKALPGPQVPKIVVRNEVTGVVQEFDRELFGEGLEKAGIEFAEGITEIQRRQLPTKKDFEKFATVFSSAAQDGIPDISTFMARRAVMGGIRSGIMSMLPGAALVGTGFGGGSWLIPAGLTWAMRYAGHVITKPIDLANLRNMLDDTLPTQVRLANMARLVRKYPEEWKEYDQELQEIQNRQSYQENVGQRMAPPLSATKKIIDAAKDGGKMLIDKAKTGTLSDPNVQKRIPFLNEESPMFADEAAETLESSSIGSSILQNSNMNPAAAASLYEGNLDQALANQAAPRMAARGGLISLIS